MQRPLWHTAVILLILALTAGSMPARGQEPCFDYDTAGWPMAGSLTLPGGANDLAATGDGYLLVAGPQGLYACDLNDPTSPSVTAYLPTTAALLEVATDGAVVAALTADARLLSGVLTAPGQVAWSGEISLSFASRLAVQEGLLIFLQGNAQLATVDLSDPKSPHYLGWIALPEAANDLAVAQGLAFLATETNFLLVYDLALPAQPQLIAAAGRIASGTAIAVEYPRVHVANLSKVVTYDASLPTELVEMGDSSRLFGYTDLLAADRNVCFAASREGHLVYLEAREDSAAVARGHTLLGAAPVGLDVVPGCAVAALADGTIMMFDAAAGTHPAATRVLSDDVPAQVVAADDLLYALDPDHPVSPRLIISTLAAPPHGTELGSLPYFGTPRALDARGDRLVMSTSLTSLTLVDIGDPELPTYISQRGQEVNTDDVAVLERSFCALGRDDFGAETLVVYDQAANGGLQIASAMRMPYGSVQVVGWRNHALIRGRFEMNGLIVVDCLDPRSSFILDWKGLPGTAIDLVASGHHAYMLADDGRIDVVSLNDPSQLEVVHTVDLGVPTVQGSLAVLGHLLLVAEPFRGMTVVDITTPETATVTGAAWTPVTGRLVTGTATVLLNDSLFNQRNYLPVACGVLSGAGEPPALRFLHIGARPNPFNPRTVLVFELPTATGVDLEIFDLRGRLVRRLLTGEPHSAGTQRVVWDGRDAAGRPLASAVYLAHLRAGAVSGRAKLVLVR